MRYTRLPSVACLVACVAVACATANQSAKPAAPGAAASSVERSPRAPIAPEATPRSAGSARSDSEASGSERAPAAGTSTSGADSGLRAPAAELQPSEPEPLSELGAAAFSGDEQQVRALLARGADVNQPERDGTTALILALSNYHDEPKCCENAEQRRHAQMTERAQRKLRIARTLIEQGANVKVTDRLDLTPLHHAVMAHGPEREVIAIMELLIARGADVNRRAQPYGRSPLEWAIAKSPERVACLLRHGADPSVVTHEGKTLLQVAEARGDARIVEQLRAALVQPTRQ